MVGHNSITQKEINVSTKGIDNLVPKVGQTEKEIDIEFGAQQVAGFRDRTKNAQKAIEHILEGDLVSEEGLRALDIKNHTVSTRVEERKGQGGVIAHNTQPNDVNVENTESITSPKAKVE